jgi:hypothetical protein
MRIHGNDITDATLAHAAASHGMTSVTVLFEPHGSRSRARAYEVQLRGTSPRRPNSGGYGPLDTDSGLHAATWDEWGMFLAAVFAADPSVTIPRLYDDAVHFHWATANRFRTLTADQQHRTGHRWEYVGPSLTGTYTVRQCKGCPAIVRTPGYGRTFAEFREA